MKRATFPFYILLTTQKNICCGVHSYCNLSNKFSLQWFLIFLIQKSGCFGSVFFFLYINGASVVLSNCFLNDYIIKSRSLLNFDKKKTAWQFDVRSHVTQGLEICVYFNINRFADLITDAICWNILLTYYRLVFIRKC